jgi:hypothetical protein
VRAESLHDATLLQAVRHLSLMPSA